MPVEPPKALAPEQESDNPLDEALQQEILAEKAATYSRLMKRLEAALEAAREAETADEAERERRLDEAGEALWHVIIQRDICGLRQHELFYREMRVPREVRLRMGLATGKKNRAGG